MQSVTHERTHVPSEIQRMTDASSSSPYTPPPGLLGDVAQFIYGAAPRPVPEIALAGAVGLLAGIVGRAYNVNGLGLNLYVLLLALTGSGKESISSGITALMRAVRQNVPASVDFIGPAAIASPQALAKHLANTAVPSFVSILGEFGLTMQQMANPKAPAHLMGLRQILLDLYGKSGRNGELRPSIYSDKEKNTKAVQSPAFSIIGESTPESFYEGASERVITDGLLPRFTMIEYRGKRPPLQTNRSEVPPQELIGRMATICAHALMLNSQGQVQDVALSELAQLMFEEFDSECDANINSATNEVTRHLWNRAHIKALKLAALVAVGCDYINPVVTPQVAMWAIQIEKANVRNLLTRFESGDVGEHSTEDVRIKRVIDAFNAYINTPWSELRNYDVKGFLHEQRIVTYTYLHRRLCNTRPFKKENSLQPSDHLKRALKTLIDRGDVVEIGRPQMMKEHQFNGIAYMLANVKLVQGRG